MLKPSKLLPLRGQLAPLITIWKSRMCRKTEMSGACASFDCDGNTKLVGSDDNKCSFGETIQMRFECTFLYGFEFIKISSEHKTINFISVRSTNIIPNAVAVGKRYIFHN